MGRLIDLNFGMTISLKTAPYLIEGDTLTLKQMYDIVALCIKMSTFPNADNMGWYIKPKSTHEEPLFYDMRAMELYANSYITWAKNFDKDKNAVTFTVKILSPENHSWYFLVNQ